MSDASDTDRFFKEAEEYLYALATRLNFGLTFGRWRHPKYGELIVRTVNGWTGAIYVTLVFCASDAWLKIGQARLWWYMNDSLEPFELKHIERRTPFAEIIINKDDDLEEAIGARLRWLGEQTSIDAAWLGMYGKALSVLAHAKEAAGDVRVALASEIPKGDEEEPE